MSAAGSKPNTIPQWCGIQGVPRSPTSFLTLPLSPGSYGMKHVLPFNTVMDFSGLNVVGNIWENVSTHLNKMYNKGRFIWVHFNM